MLNKVGDLFHNNTQDIKNAVSNATGCFQKKVKRGDDKIKKVFGVFLGLMMGEDKADVEARCSEPRTCADRVTVIVLAG